MNEERRIENIPIEKIIPNIYQPRIKFDDKSLTDLSNSIKSHGIIQPIIVRKIEDSYEIIDGERRYKAAKNLGVSTIPSIVLNIDDKEAAELILTENMQKQLLTPIEEANAYQQIMLLNKFDAEELSKKIGKDVIAIENKLKLLTLRKEIQEALLNNKIAEGHARALTKIIDKEKQLELYLRVLNERIPVKVLEEIINEEIKKENIDKVNINDLNKKEFLTMQEEEKREDTKMNFNQYNNLLKEKTNPELGIMSQPESIIGNISSEQKNNEFFPSLEEQPLNLEVTEEIKNETPQFNFASQSMGAQPMAEPTPVVEAPTAPEMPTWAPQFNFASQPMGVQPMVEPTPVVEAPTAPEMPTWTPQFNFASQPMGAQPMVEPTPVVEAPTAPEMPTWAPQFNFASQSMGVQPMVEPTPVVEAPTAPEMPTWAPQFNFASQSMGAQPMVEPTPVVEAPTAPEMPTWTPQFDFSAPTMGVQPMVEPTPVVEIPSFEQPKVMVDVMPAVNMIRNLIPLLENSGYRINIEESDNTGEYQVILKVQK